MIVGVDQALLDLVVQVDSDPNIFERYGLEQNSQCLADDRHASLFQDLVARAYMDDAGAAAEDANGLNGRRHTDSRSRAPSAISEASSALPSVQRTPGGIVANCLRAGAWSLQQQQGEGGAVAEKSAKPALKMMGMIADDYAGDQIREELVRAGVEPLLGVKGAAGGRPKNGAALSLSEGTGLCCCLIAGKERTMVTELGAGKTLDLGGNWEARIKEATVGHSEAHLPTILMTSAFYAQADPEGAQAMLAWARRPREDGRPTALLALTVSAEWCCGLPVVQALAKEADIVFANEPEIVELAAALRRAGAIPKDVASDSETSLREVAGWKAYGWVIATRGSKSVGALQGGAGAGRTPLLVPVPRLPTEEVVDDIGAGDSFSGGFLVEVWQRLARRRAQSPPTAAPWGCGEGLWQRWLQHGCCAYRRPSSGSLGLLKPRGAAVARAGAAEAELLTESDIEAAVKAGIFTAAACLRCVGCQFPKLGARPAA